MRSSSPVTLPHGARSRHLTAGSIYSGAGNGIASNDGVYLRRDQDESTEFTLTAADLLTADKSLAEFFNLLEYKRSDNNEIVAVGFTPSLYSLGASAL